MRKINVVLICLLFILIVILSVFYLSYVNTPSVVRGTYLSDDNVFLSIVFDNRDGNKFYYYHMTDGDGGMKQVVDAGTYEKVDENKYLINSTLFDGIEIEIIRDVFTLSIDSVRYTFEKWSDTPGYIDLVDYDLKLDEQDMVLKQYETELKVQKKIVKENEEAIRELESLIETQTTFPRNISFLKVGDFFINTYATGTTVLKDGIIFVIEIYDLDKEMIWLHAWSGLYVTELSTWSDYTIRDEKLYVVINGQLNSLDLNTGEVLFTVEPVGHSDDAPLITEEGLIFTIGQYEPYLTAVKPLGEIAWQITDDFYLNTYHMRLNEFSIEIECYEGVFKFDFEGNLLE